MTISPTQEEIARAVGLSRETVNAALGGNRYNRTAGRARRGTKQCSDETLELVTEAAAQMGYVAQDDRPSMAKIGRALGISHVTVRNALRGTGSVSDEMKAAIVEKAEEMNYVLPPLLKRNRGGRW